MEMYGWMDALEQVAVVVVKGSSRNHTTLLQM